jgi:4-amino-4-deoxy-L-arabinose transferase-like glycosyltransferase
LTSPFLPQRVYLLLFALAALTGIAGLFVPLMDNDAAHHANIALRMHLEGDFVNLLDNGADYLDKPHLHFWLSALSYRLFGVTAFAYKLPSFLVSIGGVYALYRLGRVLYDQETGKLSALMLCTAFAFLLSVSDVRMDALLVSFIVFSTWQLVLFIREHRLLQVIGAAAGMALGFCTKGPVGVFIPLLAAFLYILYYGNWRKQLYEKWLLMAFLFILFISPVLYCYYLQFNMHPEKWVRGRNHINGVRFILWDQSFERFGGEVAADSRRDYLFAVYNFAWAFAPWGLVAFIALFHRLKDFLKHRKEWLSPGSFIIILLLVSLSGSKLPHYLNIAFPFAALMTADLFISKKNDPGWSQAVSLIQYTSAILLVGSAFIINGWFFPAYAAIVITLVAGLLLLYLSGALQITAALTRPVILSSFAILFFFFLLNINFYPRLLVYQGGKPLADLSADRVNTERVYFWKDTYSSSWCFYTGVLRKAFSDSAINNDPVWLIYDGANEKEIVAAGYRPGDHLVVPDFEVSKLTFKFLNPATRESQCRQLFIARIYKRTTGSPGN